MKSGLHSTPFFAILRTLVPPCSSLYGHIDWSLAQAQQQSSLGFSQSVTSVRGGRTRLRAGFHFSVQKQPVAESSGGCVGSRPYSDHGTESHQSGRKSSGAGASASVTDSQKKGSHEGWHFWCFAVYIIDFYSSIMQADTLPHFVDQWGINTLSRSVLNMVRGHHLHVRAHPHWFNIKTAPAHHPVIQKEVQELLAKGAIEP